MSDAIVKSRQMWTSSVMTAVLRTYVSLSLPALLVLAGVRLVMTPACLYLEYSRPGFPEDFYGFTAEDRLRYASYAVAYLLNGEGIDFLSGLHFPDGGSLFDVRELQHMRDVKALTHIVYLAAVIAGLGASVAAVALGRISASRRDLRLGLMNGGVLTLGIIGAVVLAAIVNWDFFFTSFHTLLFESGTWRFSYSDTLIRLFPEQFWFDAALLVGGMTTSIAFVILWVTRRWEP